MPARRHPVPSGALLEGGVRVGTLDEGALAVVGTGAVIRCGGATIHWWIRAEDRWHRPDSEASERHRQVDGTPVVESTIRVPGGDVSATVYATYAEGDGGLGASPVVVLEVANRSAIPVAVGIVVVSDHAIGLSRFAAQVSGGPTVRLARQARDVVGAPSIDEIIEVVEAPRRRENPYEWDLHGAVMLVVPTPHTARATVVIEPFNEPVAADNDGPARAVAASPRIVSGWRSVVVRAPRFDAGDPALLLAWTGAVCDTLLGPDERGSLGAGRYGAALARCGLLDLADPLVEIVLGSARSNGSIADADPVAATMWMLRLASSLWSGGLERATADRLIGPVATGGHWLGRRRRRPDLGGRQCDVAAAILSVVPMLLDLDQPDVATDLRRIALRLVDESTAASAPGTDLRGAPDAVIGILDALASERDGVVELATGWTSNQAGLVMEAHGVPTRSGRVSWAIRWHGARPALLWELTPWHDRPLAVPTWRLTAIDPDWVGEGLAGEALLAAPVLGAIASGG